MTSVVKRSARAILIDDDQRLLLIRRTKQGQQPYWTTPGGGVEPDDPSVEHAMVRELREELGAEVSRAQQVFLVFDPVDGTGVGAQHFFVCRVDVLDPDRRSGPEYTEPGRGGYDLDRVAVGVDGLLHIDLKPLALKAFIESNWAALVDAAVGGGRRRLGQ